MAALLYASDWHHGLSELWKLWARTVGRLWEMMNEVSIEKDEKEHWGLSGHSQKNDPWWTVLQGTVRQAPGKKAEGLLPEVNFVSWIVTGDDFMSPATNIYTQFRRYVYSCWLSEHRDSLLWWKDVLGAALRAPWFWTWPSVLFLCFSRSNL